MSDDGPFFLDTNVLLYALDTASPAKQSRAERWVLTLWENGAGRTSWQVLNEFYANATRKMKADTAQARTIVEAYAQWMPVGFGMGLVRQAWEWADRASVSYWDALIVSAAEYTGCRFLLSEDFQEGRTFGSVRVVDPFRVDPAELF